MLLAVRLLKLLQNGQAVVRTNGFFLGLGAVSAVSLVDGFLLFGGDAFARDFVVSCQLHVLRVGLSSRILTIVPNCKHFHARRLDLRRFNRARFLPEFLQVLLLLLTLRIRILIQR